MNIIRKIKLEQLGYYQCIDNKEKEIFEFLRNFINLKPYRYNIECFHDCIFYCQEDKFIFYRRHNILWINNDLRFDKIKSDYLCNLILKLYSKIKSYNKIMNINIIYESACNQATFDGYTKYKID